MTTVNVLPDFMIVGAMKCATSTLHDQFAQLNAFHMSSPKEPNFFSDDDVYAKGFSYYQSLFENSDGKIKGESSTHYTKMPTYPETISRMKAGGIAEQKFIYVIRDPIPRLVSHYIHQWSQGVINCSIDEALDQYPELIAYSSYAYQLDFYLQAFPHKQIAVVFFEKLKYDPDPEFKALCQWLGYSAPVAWDFTMQPKNVSAQRIRKFPLYSFLIETKPMIWLRRHLVPQSLRNKVKNQLTMDERPEISAENLLRLQKIFDKDLRELGKRLKLPLDISTYKDFARQQATVFLSD